MRSYADACGITRALDVIGERWAIPVIRELVFGPRRYSDLRVALPGVSTNILGSRLKELAEAGVVAQRRLPKPAASTVYELTAWGAELEPTLISLGRWAAHTPFDLVEQALSASSFALSLKTTFDPEGAAGVTMDVRLVMNDDVFDVRISAGTFSICRSLEPESIASQSGMQPSMAPSIQLHGNPKVLADVIHGHADPAESAACGSVRLEGTPDAVATFASCFSIPQPPKEGPP
ncbi:helix-turn-helix transcriptional regulator [Cellulosimicrobium funkei]|nr:helix-turn-helix transcriptional regulator [Cellulosimicrobium funkei]